MIKKAIISPRLLLITTTIVSICCYLIKSPCATAWVTPTTVRHQNSPPLLALPASTDISANSNMSRRSLLVDSTASFVGKLTAATWLLTETTAATSHASAMEAEEEKDKEKQKKLMSERKREEKEKREKEKEAKRIAEETKKRLAVGRIGQIGAL